MHPFSPLLSNLFKENFYDFVELDPDPEQCSGRLLILDPDPHKVNADPLPC